MNRDYNVLQKQIRAKVIKQYLNSIGQNKCVCFTCGNSSKYLKSEGVDVVEVLNPERWWSFSEIQNTYKMFDATSGHLPMALMQEIADTLKQTIGEIKDGEEVACGSGETFVCLKMAFPFVNLQPVYNLDRNTKYNEQAPLNDLVDALKNTTIYKIKKTAMVRNRESLGEVRIIVEAEGYAMVLFEEKHPLAVPSSELIRK